MSDFQQTADDPWARAAECLQRVEPVAYSDRSLTAVASQLCREFAEFTGGGAATSLWAVHESSDQVTEQAVCFGYSGPRDSWPTLRGPDPATPDRATLSAGFSLRNQTITDAGEKPCRIELHTSAAATAGDAADGSIANEASRELAQSIAKLAAYAYLRDAFANQVTAQESVAVAATEDLPAAAGLIARAVARGCDVDRVSVLHVRSGTVRLLAASTTDAIDARSGHAISLQRLIRATTEAASDEQIDRLRQSHEAAAGCTVLIDTTGGETTPGSPDDRLAIVLENFDHPDDDRSASAAPLAERYQMIRPWVTAVSAAVIRQHRRRQHTLGRRVVNLVAGRRLLSAVVCLLAAWCVLSFVQVNFVLSANGRVLPIRRANVFAPADAVVTEVLVKDGDEVQTGQILVRLQSPSLRLIKEEIVGKLDTARTRQDGLQTERSNSNRSRETSSRNSLDEQIAKTEIRSLEQQLETVQQQIESLKLTASIPGVVSGWDLQTALPGKPVSVGEWLLCIDQRQADWIAEVQLPDQHAGHLDAVTAEQPLAATVRVLSRPDVSLDATFLSASGTSLRLADGTGVIPLTFRIEKPASFELPVGASVAADLDFGPRSLGFVCFRSIIQWYQRQAWF